MKLCVSKFCQKSSVLSSLNREKKGHFLVPNMPYFQGFEKFGGRILHSHDFKDAVEFAGQRALVVGTSYSSEDIASQMWKYGCKDIIFSYRTKPMAYN